MKICIRFFFVLFFLFSIPLHAQIEGSWYADLSVQGMKIPLVFHFENAPENQWTGKMDSPNQRAFGILIDEVTFRNDSLKLKVKSLGLSFSGLKNGQQIKGTFNQGAFSTELKLNREEKEVKEESQLKRPQEPKAPFPYQEEEVQFLNERDSIVLAGTLTYPKNKTNFPVVILISGSGAQDRNSEILGHKPFLVTADYLTRNGIGVLRFDDRGTGASEGDFSSSTSLDFMEDVRAAVQFVKNKENLKSSKVGLYGHSEGGMIAPLLADTYPNAVDFLVLLAPPAVAISELMLKQQELVSLASGIEAEEIELNAKINKEAYALINAYDENETSSLKNELRKYFNGVIEVYPEITENMSMGKPQYIKAMVSAYSNPWMVYFLKYKPETHLKNLKLPILALYGEKDVQVSAPENAKKMKSLILKKNLKNEVITFPKMNHLFQTSETGNIAEYAEIEETISPKVLLKVKDWIKSLP
jgi:pimeloyl-ACP methyl ester carboxylesterase